MNIDDGKLLDLLHNRKKHIKTRKDVIESALALASYIVSVLLSGILTADIRIKIAVGLLGLVYLALFFASLHGTRYSVEELFADILSCSDNHSFSLAVIKDSRGRFLLKWDKRWKTHLFPFTRTKETNNDAAIIEFVRTAVGIEPKGIFQQKETDVTKHSVSANMTKTYHHTFYLIDFDEAAVPKKDKFKHNGTFYRWYSIDDMKADKNMRLKNGETIAFVEKEF